VKLSKQGGKSLISQEGSIAVESSGRPLRRVFASPLLTLFTDL
jgi:hypothetical protein